jgi:hypothetical protein
MEFPAAQAAPCAQPQRLQVPFSPFLCLTLLAVDFWYYRRSTACRLSHTSDYFGPYYDSIVVNCFQFRATWHQPMRAAGTMDAVNAAGVSGITHQQDTLAEASPPADCSHTSDSTDAVASASHTHDGPTVELRHLSSGSHCSSSSSQDIVANMHGAHTSDHLSASPAKVAPTPSASANTTASMCEQEDEKEDEALQVPESGSMRASSFSFRTESEATGKEGGCASPRGVSMAPPSAAPVFLQRIPARRNSTLTIAGHCSTTNYAGLQQSFARRSFAAATSSAGRFNGLMYTSAIDAGGHVTTNRNASMSLGQSAGLVQRTSCKKSGSLAAGGGGEGGNRSYTQARMLRRTAGRGLPSK